MSFWKRKVGKLETKSTVMSEESIDIDVPNATKRAIWAIAKLHANLEQEEDRIRISVWLRELPLPPGRLFFWPESGKV